MNSKLSLRSFATLIGVTLLLFAQVRTATAAAPTREPVTPPPPCDPTGLPCLILPAGPPDSGVCSFDVRIYFLNNNEYNTTFTDSQGNPTQILTTGTLKVNLTNLSNPAKSIDLNISGPGLVVLGPDGTFTQTTYGPWLWIIFPGSLLDYSPRMFFISGQLVADFDSNGNQTTLQIIGGNTVDMCAALADP